MKKSSRKQVVEIWDRFAIIFGYKWERVLEEKNYARIGMFREEWVDALKNFSEIAVANALDNVRDAFTWAPSIAEFVKMCNEASKKLRYESKPEHLAFTGKVVDREYGLEMSKKLCDVVKNIANNKT